MGLSDVAEAYGDGPKILSLMAMPAMRASRIPVVMMRTVVCTAVCFAVSLR